MKNLSSSEFDRCISFAIDLHKRGLGLDKSVMCLAEKIYTSRKKEGTEDENKNSKKRW